MTFERLLSTVTAALLAATAAAHAQDAAAPAPGTPPAAAPEAAPSAPSFPSYAGPLSANTKPFTFGAGPLGELTVSGAVSGYGEATDHQFAGFDDSRADVSNAQLFVQKTSGVVQFAVQVGLYSLPSLGTPYIKATTITDLTYGPVPQAFLRIVPTKEITIIGGLIPTLYGAEYTFTFQNQNIARGLLWNQEPAVSRGVQVGYAKGKLAVNVSLNDGFYSDKLNWLVGSAAYTIDAHNTIAAVAGGNFDETAPRGFATPFFQNNGELYNILYTYKSGPWTVNPYIQYGVAHRYNFGEESTAKSETLGGALLVNRTFGHGFSLAGRGEYIKSYGSAGAGAPNLLYGNRSDAWSITLTPAIQFGAFFVRAEGSYTHAGQITQGFGFGADGDRRDQTRGTIELGVLF